MKIKRRSVLRVIGEFFTGFLLGALLTVIYEVLIFGLIYYISYRSVHGISMIGFGQNGSFLIIGIVGTVLGSITGGISGGAVGALPLGRRESAIVGGVLTAVIPVIIASTLGIAQELHDMVLGIFLWFLGQLIAGAAIGFLISAVTSDGFLYGKDAGQQEVPLN